MFALICIVVYLLMVAGWLWHIKKHSPICDNCGYEYATIKDNTYTCDYCNITVTKT